MRDVNSQSWASCGLFCWFVAEDSQDLVDFGFEVVEALVGRLAVGFCLVIGEGRIGPENILVRRDCIGVCQDDRFRLLVEFRYEVLRVQRQLLE